MSDIQVNAEMFRLAGDNGRKKLPLVADPQSVEDVRGWLQREGVEATITSFEFPGHSLIVRMHGDTEQEPRVLVVLTFHSTVVTATTASTVLNEVIQQF